MIFRNAIIIFFESSRSAKDCEIERFGDLTQSAKLRDLRNYFAKNTVINKWCELFEIHCRLFYVNSMKGII